MGGCCIGNCCVGNCCIGNFHLPCLFNRSKCCVGNHASSTSSTDENSSANELYKMQVSLQEFCEESRNRGDSVENEIIKESRVYLDELIKDVKRYNKITYGKKRLNINIERMERENRKTEDAIHGFIVNRVMKRMSLDDKECAEICKMSAGESKKQKFNDFYIKILKDAVNELSDTLRGSMENQSDKICDIIQSRIDSIYETCENKKSEFERIQSVKESGEADIENEQLRLSYMVALCDLGLNVLN